MSIYIKLGVHFKRDFQLNRHIIIILLMYIENDTKNIIEFNSSFSEEIQNNEQRNFWNLLKIK